MPLERALRAATTHRYDYLNSYVRDLGAMIDMEAIRDAGIRLGVDPLGGAGVHYWAPIAERYGLDLTVVSDDRRSDLWVHDGGLGRAHPDGPVVALRDAEADRTSRIASTSPSPATPTTTGTGSSPEARGCCRPTITSRSPSITCSSIGHTGPRAPAWARPW